MAGRGLGQPCPCKAGRFRVMEWGKPPPTHLEPDLTASKYEAQLRRRLTAIERKMGQRLHCGFDAPGRKALGSKIAWHLKRFRMGKGHTCVLQITSRAIRGRPSYPGTFTTWVSLPYYIMSQYQYLRKKKPKACQHGVMAICKIMTGLMKMGGPYITPPLATVILLGTAIWVCNV